MEPIRELLNLIFPSSCGVCQKPGADLCSEHLLALTASSFIFHRGEVSGYAAITYSQEVASALNSFKEKGQLALAKEFARLMKEPLSFYRNPPGLLVPAPSRLENFRKRGYHPALSLAQQLSGTWRVSDALRFNRQVSDQVGLDQQARKENLFESMRVRLPVRGINCLIVDDVVTTGATILEANRALLAAGANVVGVVTLAATA